MQGLGFIEHRKRCLSDEHRAEDVASIPDFQLQPRSRGQVSILQWEEERLCPLDGTLLVLSRGGARGRRQRFLVSQYLERDTQLGPTSVVQHLLRYGLASGERRI